MGQPGREKSQTMLSPEQLMQIYDILLRHFGPQGWWPAHSRLEIVVSAILVQNTNWKNVAKALTNLKQAGKLNWPGISGLSIEQLAGLIRPSGYYNLKAQRLYNLLQLLKQFSPWTEFFRQERSQARAMLLKVKGIGQETADAILLYAGKKPVFVVDAYTLRLLNRHGWLPAHASYSHMQRFFMERLPLDTQIFNEFHALIVALGKRYCFKNNPACMSCPLLPWKP